MSRTFSLLNPASMLLRLMRLRVNSPAPTNSTSEKATCEMTSAFASGLFVVPFCAPRPSFSASVNSSFVARSAGSVPKRSAVSNVIAEGEEQQSAN